MAPTLGLPLSEKVIRAFTTAGNSLVAPTASSAGAQLSYGSSHLVAQSTGGDELDKLIDLCFLMPLSSATVPAVW
jgi:hypothetical protein